MKIFANKKIWKKIVIIFLIISIFSFTTPEPVSADIGGTLMSPIISLFVGLADGVNTIINAVFLKQEPTIITIRDGIQNPILRFIVKTGLKIGNISRLVTDPIYKLYSDAKFVLKLFKTYERR